jgi:hypothetical protein
MSNTTLSWFEHAQQAGTLPTRVDRDAPLAERIAEAKAGRLSIGTIYARSSGAGLADDHQVAECLAYAARHGIFVPAEFIFVDRTAGRAGREGLRRAEATLDESTATVLLITDLARAFGTVYRAMDHLWELVTKGVRVIVVRQEIDTNAAKSGMLLTLEGQRAAMEQRRRRISKQRARLRDGQDGPSD